MNRKNSSRPSRPGFTLVELLVVITIIGMLVALLLPAVNMARGTARKATCLNNMRQIGMAIAAYETAKQRYPGYVQPVKRSASLYATVVNNSLAGSAIDTTNQRLQSMVSWAAAVSPYGDLDNVWDDLQDLEVASGEAGQARAVVKPQAMMTCPEDTDLTALADNAGLSYVVNAGSWDYNGPTYLQGAGVGDTKANGIFHNLTQGNLKMLMTDIKDGASSTMLLSENIHRNENYSWMGVTYSGGSNEARPEAHYGMVWIHNAGNSGNVPPGQLLSTDPSELENGSVQNRQAPLSQDVISDFNSIGLSPGYVRPSSGHARGSFNVVFADGNGRAIAPEIDPLVYQQLMAPNNRDCVDSFSHANVGDPINTYRMSPPPAPAAYQ